MLLGQEAARRTLPSRELRHLRFGLIGYGYWGPLLLRNLARLEQVKVALLADLSEQRLAEAVHNHPGLAVTREVTEVFTSDVDAVLIATPLSTHFVLAHQALKHGKHVFIEKPLVSSTAEARLLIALAAQQQRTLMVGHTFEYSPEVECLRQMVQEGQLGRIYSITSSRLNLGVFRQDADVIWDLAPHDISMINFILGKRPLRVSAHGAACIREGLIDIAYLDFTYPENIIAHAHLSWLNPNKERRFTIVGDRRMVCYDDTAINEKIKIYNRGVDNPDYATDYNEFQLSYRYGEIVIPFIQSAEPLAVQCRHFADAIRNGTEPRSNGEVGLSVVKIIEAAHESLALGSTFVDIAW